MDRSETTSESPTFVKLLKIIVDRLEWPTDDEPPEPGTAVGEGGLGLDSLMVVEFALDIEEEFDLELNEEAMLEIGSMNLAEVTEFVNRHVVESAS